MDVQGYHRPMPSNSCFSNSAESWPVLCPEDTRFSVRVDIVIIYQSIFPFFIWIVDAQKNRCRPVFLVDLSYWFREYRPTRRFAYG